MFVSDNLKCILRSYSIIMLKNEGLFEQGGF